MNQRPWVVTRKMELPQLPGLLWIMVHADPPEELFGTHSADVGRQPLDAPCDRPVDTLATIGFRIFLRHILGIFVGPGRLLEPGPRMHVHPIVTRQFCPERVFNRLPDFTGNLRWRARAWATVRFMPDRIARADHRDLDAVLVPDPEHFPGARFVTVIL